MSYDTAEKFNDRVFRDVAGGNAFLGARLYKRFTDHWTRAAERIPALGLTEDRGQGETL